MYYNYLMGSTPLVGRNYLVGVEDSARSFQNKREENGFDVAIKADSKAVDMLGAPNLSVSEKGELDKMYREHAKNARDTEESRRKEDRTDYMLEVLGKLVIYGAAAFVGTKIVGGGSLNLIGTGDFLITN